MASLDQNSPARAVALNEEERILVKNLQLLTMKPMIYAANVAEGDLADQGASNHHVKALRGKAAEENCEVIIVSAQVSRFCPMHAWVSADAEGVYAQGSCSVRNETPQLRNSQPGRHSMQLRKQNGDRRSGWRLHA